MVRADRREAVWCLVGVSLEGPFELGAITTGYLTVEKLHAHALWSKVTRMDRHELFAFEWPHPADESTGDDQVLAGAPRTTVEFRLQPTESGTTLTVVEWGLRIFPKPNVPKRCVATKAVGLSDEPGHTISFGEPLVTDGV